MAGWQRAQPGDRAAEQRAAHLRLDTLDGVDHDLVCVFLGADGQLGASKCQAHLEHCGM